MMAKSASLGGAAFPHLEEGQLRGKHSEVKIHWDSDKTFSSLLLLLI
jgi:hypothetical protein